MQLFFLYVRSAIFVIWLYGWMVLLGLLCAPLLLGSRRWSGYALRLYIHIVFFGLRWICGTSWRLEGKEYIPQDGALIASQHQSMFEVFAPWLFLPDPAIVLKKELVRLPFFGWYALKLNNIVVDRSAGAKALRKMHRDAQDRTAQGRQILIFPQGTRVQPGRPIKLQTGIVSLYRSMQHPCIPMVLNAGEYWSGHGILRRPGQIILRLLPPIEPGLSKQDFLQRLQQSLSEGDQALRS